MSALSNVLSTHVGRRRKFGEVSYTTCTGIQAGAQGNDFALVTTVKIETRNHLAGYFGSKFPAIYNHCGVVAAGSRKTVFFWEICAFFKRLLKVKFSKFCSESFQREHRSMCCVQISLNFAYGKSVKSCVVLTWQTTKFHLALQLSKSARASPPTMWPADSTFHHNRFTFGGVIAERVNTAVVASCPV